MQNDQTITLSKDVRAVLRIHTPAFRDSIYSILDIPLYATLEGLDAHFLRPLTVTLHGAEGTVDVVNADTPFDAVPTVTSVRYSGDAGLRAEIAPPAKSGGDDFPRISIFLEADDLNKRPLYRGMLYLTTEITSLPEIPVPLLVRVQP